MRYVLGMCLVALVAAPAMGTPITNVVFLEDFENDAPGTLMKNMLAWSGGNNDYNVGSAPGGNPGQFGELVGNGNTNDYVWTTSAYGAMNSTDTQIFQFDAKNAGPGVGNRTNIYVLDQFGAMLGNARWYGDSVRLIPRVGGTVGAAIPLTGAWNTTLGIEYDQTTGILNFTHNGVPVWVPQNIGPGLYMERIEMNNQWAGGDVIHVDNMVLGTPEPAALALFGLSALLLRRRR